MSAFGFHLPRATIDRGMASCLEYALGDCGLRSKKKIQGSFLTAAYGIAGLRKNPCAGTFRLPQANLSVKRKTFLNCLSYIKQNPFHHFSSF